MVKKILLTLWLVILFGAISYLFWRNEYKYSLPTPVPENHKEIAMGEQVDFGKLIKFESKPIFIHFFNPNCPCSRFNVPHVSDLIKKYGNVVDFKIVVFNTEEKFTVEEIQDKFDTKILVFFDEAIAKTCGVFSTPQAVLIDANQKLYYRGNYNKTRYCTNTDSNYAQMALDSLISKSNKPAFDALALRAYGCSLPKCTK